jgi:hypothetical protein
MIVNRVTQRLRTGRPAFGSLLNVAERAEP